MFDVFPGFVDQKSPTHSAHAAKNETAKKTPPKPEQTNKPPVFRPTAAKGVDKQFVEKLRSGPQKVQKKTYCHITM